jgi:tryptophan-rich sensory protein
MIALASATIGLMIKLESFQGWYGKLIKPWFGPSDTVLAVVWIVLHVLLGVSGYVLWHHEYVESEERPIGKSIFILLYLLLVLTFGWMWIFFGLELPLVALFERIATLVVIILMVIKSLKISRLVSVFYVACTLWCIYLLAFNISIVLLN